MADQPVTVSEIEAFIKKKLIKEDVTVSGYGHDVVEIVITNPNANLGFIFSELFTNFGAAVTEANNGKGTYTITLPNPIEDDKRQQEVTGVSIRGLVLSVLVLGSAVWIGTMISTHWHLVREELQKDGIPS